jgi:predicted ABC-type ATPase
MSTQQNDITGWVLNPDNVCHELSHKQEKEVASRIFIDAIRGKQPVGDHERPHMLMCIGTPGAGKSSISKLIIAHLDRKKLKTYVTLDVDELVKYHPNYTNANNLVDVFGKKTNIGYAYAHSQCSQYLMHAANMALSNMMESQYNIILHSHDFSTLINAKSDYAYQTSLAFISTPLVLAQSRARKRALNEGRFLSVDLEKQDSYIAMRWYQYKMQSPWYAMWADEFIIATNRDNKPSTSIKKEIAIIDPQSVSLGDTLNARIGAIAVKIEEMQEAF